MLAQTMLRAVPDRVLTWVFSTDGPLQRAALRRAARRALRAFAERRPEWVALLFDATFLEGAAAPLLRRCIQPRGRVAPEELAAAWVTQVRSDRRQPARFLDAVAAAADFLMLLEDELRPYRARAPYYIPGGLSVEAPPPAGTVVGDDLFSAALRDFSNLESDWLWLAGKVTRESERRYCLERALYINPQSQAARDMVLRGGE